MSRSIAPAVLGLTLLAFTGLAHAQKAPAEKAPPAPAATETEKLRALPVAMKPWKGDFQAMLERRSIRVLVPFSRTLYFNDKGRERGLTADLVREVEQHLNKMYAKQLGKRPLTVLMIPTTRDQLLSGVTEGLGDIAAGNITVTDERLETVDFYSPEDAPPISEVVVTGPSSPSITLLDDLSGKRVHVRPSSSYHESLEALNKRFKSEKKPLVELVPVPDALKDEDMMEMLNAGLLQAIVVDDWKAKTWAKVLPKIVVHENAAVRTGGRTGWAFRKQSPELRAVLDKVYRKSIQKQHSIATRYAVFLKNIKQISNNTGGRDVARFESTIELFRRHATKYGFDPLMLAAQGYQESRLDQNVRSPVGAIGVMQVMPATGKEMKVGDIHKVEANIQAGAKYMDHIMETYFSDAHFNEANRTLFAFASYNAGPGRVSKLRTVAAQRGLDPDKWFNNVEIVTAEKVGKETTTYVRNIYKYYVAYTLIADMQDAQRRAREQLSAPPGAGK